MSEGHRYNLRERQKAHTYKCTLCGKSFISENKLSNHQNAVESCLKLHSCEICGSDFKTNEGLKIHKSRKHFKKGPSTSQNGVSCDLRNIAAPSASLNMELDAANFQELTDVGKTQNNATSSYENDYKKLIQQSAVATKRPTDDEILQLIKRSAQCVPNLEELKKNVADLRSDMQVFLKIVNNDQTQ